MGGEQGFEALSEGRIAMSGATQEAGTLRAVELGRGLKEGLLPSLTRLQIGIRFVHLYG